MATNAPPTSVSIFFPGLCLLFIGLKLTENIDWSWWWVLSPLWIPFCLGVLIVFSILIFSVLEDRR